MRDERVLGWYNLRGTAFVTLDVVSDPLVLASVVNHEATHHLLSATTPHGFVQQVIEGYLDEPWADQENLPLRQCRNRLFAASRLPQEAAATYCGLVDLEGEALARVVATLPPYYRSAYRLFEGALPRDELDTITRFRAARAIACRALQTAILRDWIPYGLHDIDALSAYLAESGNSPEERLKVILRELADRTADQMVAWSGRHFNTADGMRLQPATLPPLGDLEFSALPASAEMLSQARRILRTLSVERGHDAELIPLAFQEVSIQPAAFGVRNLRLEQVSTRSCGGTDFIMVDRNVFGRPISLSYNAGEFQVLGGHSRIVMHRPDSRVPVLTVATLDSTPTVLDTVDPTRSATICVGGLGVLPKERYEGPKKPSAEAESIMTDLLRWTSGRTTIIYTFGQREGLLLSTTLLEHAFGRLQNHAMLWGSEWGFVLFRSASGAGPLVVHPTLVSEWQRQLPLITAVTAMDLNVESAVFYRGDYRNVLPVLRFVRAFTGATYTEEGWAEFWTNLAASLATDPLYHVNSRLTGNEFDRDH